MRSCLWWLPSFFVPCPVPSYGGLGVHTSLFRQWFLCFYSSSLSPFSPKQPGLAFYNTNQIVSWPFLRLLVISLLRMKSKRLTPRPYLSALPPWHTHLLSFFPFHSAPVTLSVFGFHQHFKFLPISGPWHLLLLCPQWFPPELWTVVS